MHFSFTRTDTLKAFFFFDACEICLQNICSCPVITGHIARSATKS